MLEDLLYKMLRQPNYNHQFALRHNLLLAEQNDQHLMSMSSLFLWNWTLAYRH